MTIDRIGGGFLLLVGLLLLRGGLAPAFRTLKWGEGRHAAAIPGCSLFAT